MYVKDVNPPAVGVMCISLYMHVLRVYMYIFITKQVIQKLEDRKTEERERKAFQNNSYQATIGHSKRVGHSRDHHEIK